MQAAARPRFRQDLLAEVIEEGGQKFIDVADPDGNALYRFFEVEYAIACAMDGQRDVAGIVKWAQDELGLSASTNEVQSVIDTLSGLAFIGEDQLVDQAAAKVATQTPAAQAQPAQSAAASAPVAATAAATVSKPPSAAKAGDDLAAGVVVGKAVQSGAAKGLDIELGSSGSSAPVAQAKEAPVGDIALGAPGASQSKAPPKIPVEDVALGAPGAAAAAAAKKPAATADVSMDLSAEMSIGKGDVKEAVRQSKVMTAVEVPKELLEAEASPAVQPAKPKAEAKKEEKKPEPKKEEPKKEAPVSTASGSAKKEEKKPEPKKEEPKKEAPASTASGSSKKDEKKAESKKDEKKAESKKDEKSSSGSSKKDAKAEAKKPVVEKAPEKQPVAPPAPASGVSPALIVTLIVVIVAAGAFLAYKFVFAKEEQPRPVPTAVKPAAPPPPLTSAAKVVLEAPAAAEVKAGVAGALETVEPVGKDVKAGDTIAVLAGAKPLQTEIEALTKQIEQLKAPVAVAEEALKVEQAKENNEAAATAAQKKLDALKKPVTDKEAQLKTKQEALDKLAIKSTGDGKIAVAGETELKAGDKIVADQVVAKIERATVPTAVFKIPAGAKIGAQGTLSVKVDGGDKTVVCNVTDAQNESVKVACPADAGLADGAGVTITLPSS